jgi:hypothetical protein
MKLRYATVGPLSAGSATALRAAATIAGAGALTLLLTTLDNQRRILITTAASETITLTLAGNNKNGDPVTEVIQLAGAGTYQSVLDYYSNLSVVASGASSGNVSIGTNGVASSGWVQMDPGVLGTALAQLIATGTVNFTLQYSLDDPNDSNPQNSVIGNPSAVVWTSTNDTAAVGATASVVTNLMFVPVWVRILLNSGSGSVRGTFSQQGGRGAS